MGRRLSYATFRAAFITAWLLVVGALLCAAARARIGFVLLVCAGFLLAALGALLALNSGKLSDRMVDEVASRWGSGAPSSVTRFGGALLLVIGAGIVILGLVGLSQ